MDLRFSNKQRRSRTIDLHNLATSRFQNWTWNELDGFDTQLTWTFIDFSAAVISTTFTMFYVKGGVEDTRLEAKAKDSPSVDRPSLSQGH